jgi:hypothetical protein
MRFALYSHTTYYKQRKEERMPLFEPLSMEKQRLYLGRLQESRIQASDYSFINLWGWAEEYGLLWA